MCRCLGVLLIRSMVDHTMGLVKMSNRRDVYMHTALQQSSHAGLVSWSDTIEYRRSPPTYLPLVLTAIQTCEYLRSSAGYIQLHRAGHGTPHRPELYST